MTLIRPSFVLVLLSLFFAPIAWSAEPTSFPTFGVSYTVPPETTFDMGRARGMVGHYVFNPSSRYVRASIAVEVDLASGKPLAFWSNAFAGRPGTVVDPKETVIGSEKAVKFSFKPPGTPAHEIVSYIAVHEDRLYVISSLAPEGFDVSKPLSDLRASIKFIPIEPSIKHLNEFLASPVEPFGLCSIIAPQCLREWGRGEHELSLGIWDLAPQGNPLNVNIQHMQAPAPRSFAEIKDGMSQALQTQLHLSEALQWRDQDGVPGLHVSQPVIAKLKLPNGTEGESFNRFCMLDLGKGNFVQVLFTISKMPPQDVQKYVELSDRMLASVKVLPTQPPPKP